MKLNKKIVISSAALLAIFANSAFASSNEELAHKIKHLEDKITKLERLLEHKTPKQDITVNEKVQVVEYSPVIQERNDSVKFVTHPSPKIQTADGDYSLGISAYMHTDWAMFGHDNNNDKSTAQIRNARFAINGVMAKDWVYKLENNITNNNSRITSAYVGYKGFDPVELYIGQIGEPFSLEDSMSTKHLLNIERSPANTFAPGSNVGFLASTYGSSWGFAAGVFGNNTANTDTSTAMKAVTARFTVAPINEGGKLVHLGASGSLRKSYGDYTTGSYTVKPGTALANNILNTGSMQIKKINLGGLEAAVAYNNVYVMGEYIKNTAKLYQPTALTPHGKFDGGYVQASWILTGESRPYDVAGGIFGTVSPAREFNLAEKNWGAFEVSTRYGHAKLNGKVDSYDLGLNWYPNNYVKFMTNYVAYNGNHNAIPSSAKPRVFLVRTQIAF